MVCLTNISENYYQGALPSNTSSPARDAYELRDSGAYAPTTPSGTSQQPLHVAIIGGGPRAISVAERISASVTAECVVWIHIIDPVLGGGSVWSSARNNDELLMNTVASQVTVFTDPTVTCQGPIRPGPSLYEWSTRSVDAQNSRLGPDDYPTRSQYGSYLTWVIEKLCADAPVNVRIKLHLAHAIRLDDARSGHHQIVSLSDGQSLRGITAVVLAQGHVTQQLKPSEQRHERHARAQNLRYIPPSNPATAELCSIRAGEKVFLQGLGLCFFDYLARFTSGRGGIFTNGSDGTLKYVASGKEPLLYAGSSRGIPSHARPENQKGIDRQHKPLLLTDDQLVRLRLRANQGDPSSFSRDIQPLIMREMECVYYTTLLRLRGGNPVGFQHFAMANPYEPLTTQTLRQFGIGQADQESWEASLEPQVRSGIRCADHRDWMLSYLAEDSRQAALGNVRGPHGAARDALRDLRNQIRLAVDHDKITGLSREIDLDRNFTPLSNFLSVGPPRRRIDELIALMKAGVVSIMGPGITIERHCDMWTVKSTTVPDYQLQVMTLISAYLPKTHLSTTSDPLMTYLLQTGQCKPHMIDGFETGAIDITEAPFHLKNRRGQAHPARFVIGVPTEGIHWTTTAGARPGVNSVMLQESDAIAQAVCALLSREVARVE